MPTRGIRWIALLLLTLTSSGRADEFPLKALEVDSADYQTLYAAYEKASMRSLVEAQTSLAELRKSAFVASERIAKSYQSAGKIEEFLAAESVMKQLDPSTETAPSIAPDAKDPSKVAELKEKWLESSGKIEHSRRTTQQRLALKYAQELEPISAELLKASEVEAAKAIHEEIGRLRKLYDVAKPAAEEKNPPKKTGLADKDAEAVKGHFYLLGEDVENWILYVNGHSLKMKDSKSEEVSLSVGDIVVMKYPTFKGRGMMLGFLSADKKKAIHLRAKNLKLFGDENPRTISARKIEGREKTLRAVGLGSKVATKWKEFGLLPESKGGSQGMMYDWQGKHLIAFEVKEDTIVDMPEAD